MVLENQVQLRKKVNNPVKASFYYGVEKYIFLCLLIWNVANNSFYVKGIGGGVEGGHGIGIHKLTWAGLGF